MFSGKVTKGGTLPLTPRPKHFSVPGVLKPPRCCITPGVVAFPGRELQPQSRPLHPEPPDGESFDARFDCHPRADGCSPDGSDLLCPCLLTLNQRRSHE